MKALLLTITALGLLTAGLITTGKAGTASETAPAGPGLTVQASQSTPGDLQPALHADAVQPSWGGVR